MVISNGPGQRRQTGPAKQLEWIHAAAPRPMCFRPAVHPVLPSQNLPIADRAWTLFPERAPQALSRASHDGPVSPHSLSLSLPFSRVPLRSLAAIGLLRLAAVTPRFTCTFEMRPHAASVPPDRGSSSSGSTMNPASACGANARLERLASL